MLDPDDVYNWDSNCESSEDEEVSPERGDLGIAIDSDSSDEINELDTNQGIQDRTHVFKKLSRTDRDRNMFLQLKTLDPVKVHISSLDILDSARRFLSKNTINLCKTRTVIDQEIIPQLKNLRRFERARQGMMLRKVDAVQSPRSARLFDYVFAQTRIEGRSLTYTVTWFDSQTFTEFTDLEIARLINKPPAERMKLAPQAWTRDRLRPEYYHVAHLTDEHGKPVMTPKQIKLVLAGGRRTTKSVEEREKFQRFRATQASKAYWKILIIDSTRGKKKYKCPICGNNVVHAQLHMDAKHINYGPRPSFPVVKHDNPLGIPETAADFILHSDQYPDRKIVERIARGIVEFLLRWKFSLNLGSAVDKSLILAIVAQKVGATVIHTKPRVKFREGTTQATELAIYHIYLVDPSTHKHYRLRADVNPSRIQNLNIPPTPSWVFFPAHMDIRVASREDSLIYAEANAAPQVKSALALQRYIAYQIEWKEVNKADARMLIDFYIQQYSYSTLDGQDQNGYNKASDSQPVITPLGLVKVWKDKQNNISLLSPTELLARRVSQPLNVVIIKSIKGSEIAIAVNAAISQWIMNGNPIETWRALNIAADTLNTDLEENHPLESVCHCGEDNADFCSHPCDMCMLITVCSSLQRHETASGEVLRICPFCFDKVKARLAKKKWKASGSRRLRQNLQRLVRRETKHLNIQTADKIQQFEEAWTDLQGFLKSKDQAEDAYTATLVEIDTPSISVSRNILSLSIDAVFPYASYPDKSKGTVLRVHSPGNIIFTLLCNNLGKHISLPGILHIVAYCWSHLRPQSTSKELMAMIHARVLEQANNIHLVRLNAPYTVSSRLEIPYEEDQYNKIRDDWIRGAPRDEDRGLLLRKRAYTQRRYREPDEWNGVPLEHDRIISLVRELEDEAGKKVLRGDDGCPYPFPGNPPDDWTWWTFWCLLSERVSRMWVWCNGLWDQLDDVETLFLVTIQTHLGLLVPEPFKLPLSIYIKHPLRFAVAHKVHKQQIRSGWETNSPSHLREFDPSLHNMELQTVFSNFFLSDVHNDTYPIVQDEILKIMIPPKWYNPTHLLEVHKEQVEEDLSPSPDNDLDISMVSLSLGTYEKASFRRYASMLLEHSLSNNWMQKDILWDNFTALEDEYRTRLRAIDDSAGGPQVRAITVAEDPAGQTDIALDDPLPRTSTAAIRGLENANLLCWLNSTVRLLKQIEPLQRKIISFNTIELIDPYGEDTELVSFQARVVALMAKAMSELDIRGQKPLRLTELANACAKVEKFQWDENQARRRRRGERTDRTLKFKSKWRPGQNQDPEEFIQWFLPMLIEVGAVGDEELNAMLNVKTVEEVRCALCSTEQTSTKWMDKSTEITLKLVFPNWIATSETLGALFEHTFRGEDNIEYAEACPRKIAGHGNLYRKTWIGGLAEYVIVHLVRTGANEEGVQARIPAAIQDRPEIDFSALGKPGEEFAKQYKLVAEIQHIGDYSTPYNGHYITYSQVDGGWLKFNDDYITWEEPWRPRPGELSYLLLYKCNDWDESRIPVKQDNTVLPPEDEITYIHDTPERSLSPKPAALKHKIVSPSLDSPKIHRDIQPLDTEHLSKTSDLSNDNEISPAEETSVKRSRPQKPIINQEDIDTIISLDSIKERYSIKIKRYFAKYKEPDGSCSHTDLLINTFDGARTRDGRPNEFDETMALLKIWREALSAVAHRIPRSRFINYWKLGWQSQSVPDALSGSDRDSWDVSSTESDSESEVEDEKVIPISILGTSVKLGGVMCFRVVWTPIPGLPNEPTWEPVKGFWERWEHVAEVRAIIEEWARIWKFGQAS